MNQQKKKYGVPQNITSSLQSSWGKNPYEDIKEQHLQQVESQVWQQFAGSKKQLEGKNIYLCISEIFKKLEHDVPTAEQVLELFLKYDDNENLTLEQSEFKQISRDICGLSDVGRQKYR